ncbi:MAG: phosphotyrosine protein phosphatase [Lachnospiraceae bacterium]|nr:phosphotyrosine protein phosphatase [Lachnospiraceae bacterium]
MWKKVLFVSNDDTCRAPIAAAILKEKGIEEKGISVETRGLVSLFPEPVNQKAAAVLISHGIEADDHRSAPLKAEDVDENTLVLVMEHKQLQKALAIIGEDKAQQTTVLTELTGEELDVMNPYGAPLPTYGLCYESLLISIGKLYDWLLSIDTDSKGEENERKEN